MMAIFFTKYLGGVVQARQLPIIGNPVFVGAVSVCYASLAEFFWRGPSSSGVQQIACPKVPSDPAHALRNRATHCQDQSMDYL